MALNRQVIVDAAIVVLDDVGLPDLTMRRVASHVGVAPGALYWHIPNKQSLLAAIADDILRIPADLTGTTWDARLREIATALRGCLLGHRDGAEVVSASLASRLGDNNIHARVAAVARDAGVNDTDAQTVANALVHFVVGFTFEEQTHQLMDTVAAARAPYDAAVSARSFADGVDLLIDGLRHRLP